MTEQRRRVVELGLASLAMVLLISYLCRGAEGQVAAPTPDIHIAQTQAVQTFAQSLTQDAHALPTRRPTSTPSLRPTPAPLETTSPTEQCLSLRFVRDVTVPDNTQMTPAQVFTKTWQVENNGSCTWRAGFRVVLIGGVAMGGSPFRLAQPVGPGGSVQVSIKMAAPTNQAGTLQGTWKMSDESGVVFGDYLSVIVVISAATGARPTQSTTASP